MALTPQQIREYRQKYFPSASIVAPQVPQQTPSVAPTTPTPATETAPQPNVLQRVKGALDKTRQETVSSIMQRGPRISEAIEAKQPIGAEMFEVAGEAAGTAQDLIGGTATAIGRVLKALSPTKPLAPGEKSQGGKIVEKITSLPGMQDDIKALQNVVTEWKRLEKEDPRKAAQYRALGNIAMTVLDAAGIPAILEGGAGLTARKVGQQALDTLATPGRLAVEGATTVAKPVVGAVKATGEFVGEASSRITSKVLRAVEPIPPTPTKAVGQVLQGETSDIVSGIKGFSNLDTEGVKTYSDLKTRIDKKITELAEKVDADLGVDTTRKPLSELTVTKKTASGKPVKISPVSDALTQLEELYTRTADAVSSANIKELIEKANTQGLTRLEVNDIARVYGSEFKSKAFSKLGDPLTSVNAQMYENTRTALKDIARQGINGTEAKAADKAMSSLYDMQTLIEKNVQAVNKLQQKITERGLMEKVGYLVSKYGDILTGGSLRGIVGGLLPRGAGYKVMNALDLEQALAKNLKIIQKAIASGSDEEILKILQTLNSGK